ncbi:MAG: membrane protein insertion efficiency factor YidD [Phycisphaeraceae bacterium]
MDAALPPRYQVLANAAIFAVNGYQVLGRPLVRHVVVCRFHPSCSDYSKQAFAKYGFWRGAGLTIYRLSRCRPPMPMGTVDEP